MKLSIRDMKKCLKVKGIDTSSVVERSHLTSLFSEHVKADEVEELLKKTTSTPKPKPTSTNFGSNSNFGGRTSATSYTTQQWDNFSNLSGEQIRSQLLHMADNSESFLRQNAALKSMNIDAKTVEKQFRTLAQLKPEQLKQMSTLLITLAKGWQTFDSMVYGYGKLVATILVLLFLYFVVKFLLFLIGYIYNYFFTTQTNIENSTHFTEESNDYDDDFEFDWE
eukprot:g5294.t1